MSKSEVSKQLTVVFWVVLFVLSVSASFCMCANGVYAVDRMVHGNGCY